MIRNQYLDKIKNFIDSEEVKVLVGLRRSGKSTILEQVRDLIIFNNNCNVIYINFEELKWDFIKNYTDLNKYIEKNLSHTLKNYIFIDEIQTIDRWEKTINSIRTKKIADIYITGSNSKILSSDLSTLLAGRYISININSFNFKEVIEFSKDKKINADENILLNNYISYGGMPQLIPLYNSNSYQQLLIDIYNSIILKDIIQHNDIKNSNLMGLLINFMIDNTSKITSPNKIMESFLKDNRNTNIETLYKYIDSIVSSCLLEKVKRYDVKGKNILSTLEKFYLADVCFRNLIPNSDNQLGRKLENIIYNELKFFSSSINVGKFDTKEIDFVVVSNTMNKYYIQVAYELNTSETIEREFSPLRKLTDGCKRFVISMNSGYSEEGINNISVKEFLLNIEDYIK